MRTPYSKTIFTLAPVLLLLTATPAAAALTCQTFGKEVLTSKRPPKVELDRLGLVPAAAKAGDEGLYRLTTESGSWLGATITADDCKIELLVPVGKSAQASPSAPPTEGDKNSKPNERDEKKAEPDKYKLADSWSVPASPGFDIIGATPNLASLPKTPQELSAQIVAGRATDGTFQKGIAVDATLGQLLNVFLTDDQVRYLVAPKLKAEPNWGEGLLKYLNFLKLEKRDWALENRFMNRVKVSLATTQEESNATAPIHLGLGVHYTLWDYGDITTSCLNLGKALKEDEVFDKSDKSLKTETLRSEYRNKLDTAKKSCKALEGENHRLFASSSAAAGYARAYKLDDGKWGSRKPGAKGIWFTLATGGVALEELTSNKAATGGAKIQGILHFRSIQDEPTTIRSGDTIVNTTQDVRTLAARIKLGTPGGNASIEHAQSKRRPTGADYETTRRTSLGLEWQISKDLWLVASGGRQFSSLTGRKDEPFVITNLRFGSSPKVDPGN